MIACSYFLYTEAHILFYGLNRNKTYAIYFINLNHSAICFEIHIVMCFNSEFTKLLHTYINMRIKFFILEIISHSVEHLIGNTNYYYTAQMCDCHIQFFCRAWCFDSKDQQYPRILNSKRPMGHITHLSITLAITLIKSAL